MEDHPHYTYYIKKFVPQIEEYNLRPLDKQMKGKMQGPHGDEWKCYTVMVPNLILQ
jgi:hypothetical protein